MQHAHADKLESAALPEGAEAQRYGRKPRRTLDDDRENIFRMREAIIASTGYLTPVDLCRPLGRNVAAMGIICFTLMEMLFKCKDAGLAAYHVMVDSHRHL